jgi:beta-glucanase (GH16 family)
MKAYLLRKVLAAVGTVIVIATGCGGTPRQTLIWSDEFTGSAAQSQPDPLTWTYDTGASGWGNNELETYCAWGSTTGPCNANAPNAFVGSDGYLHIVAREDSKGNYTSARLKTEGLQGFQYGRIEARIKITEGEGFWPAFWMMGDDISSVKYPACGELDIMENSGSEPSVTWGSVHGTGFTTEGVGTTYTLPNHAKLGDDFHVYGMLWSPKQVEYYVDDMVFARFTPSSLPAGAIWPFDHGKFFFILNIAVGGNWPGSPDEASVFPQEMLIDYVRLYSIPGK